MVNRSHSSRRESHHVICQHCGIEAPTKYVAFYQNIGLLVMRFSKSAEGNMCKPCVHSTFWSMTATTLVLGWWGIISFIMNIFFVLNNVFRYLFCLGMASPEPGAVSPVLTDDAVARLGPHTESMFGQLEAGETFEKVAEDTAQRAGVTKGQVALYVSAIIAAAEEQ